MKILNYKQKVFESYGGEYDDYKSTYDREYENGEVVCVYYSTYSPEKKMVIEYIDDRGVVSDFDEDENSYLVTMIKDKHSFWVNYDSLTRCNYDEPEDQNYEEWIEEGLFTKTKTQETFEEGNKVRIKKGSYKDKIGKILLINTIPSTNPYDLEDKIYYIVDFGNKRVSYDSTNFFDKLEDVENSNMEEWIEEGNHKYRIGQGKKVDFDKLTIVDKKDFKSGRLMGEFEIGVLPSGDVYLLRDGRVEDVEYLKLMLSLFQFDSDERILKWFNGTVDKLNNDKPENQNYEEWIEENFKVINENNVKIVQKIKGNRQPFTILKIYENKITDLNDYEYTETQANRILEKYNITVDEIKNSKYRKTK